MAKKLSMSDGRDKKSEKITFLLRKEFYQKYLVPGDEKTVVKTQIYPL